MGAVRIMMSVLVLCFISVHIFVDHVDCSNFAEYLTDSLPQLCPHSNFCNHKATPLPTYPPSSPCCKYCSCDETCISTGNCCPDYPNHDQDPISSNIKPCMPHIHSTMQTANQLDGLNLGFNLYYTYNDCPADYTDEVIREKCVNPDLAIYDELVTVSDRKGRVFKNRNCALCYGISDIISWNLKMWCSVMSIDSDFAYLPVNGTLYSRPCSLFSSAPDEYTGMSSRCFRSSVNKCNETGRWTEFDENIQRACEKVSTSFFYIDYSSYRTIYKNPYCFLCNNGPNSSLDMLCPPDNIQRSAGAFVLTALLDIVALAELAALGKLKKGGRNQLPAMCNGSHIYDSYFNTCRPLLCPMGSIPAYGSCILPYKQMDGMTVYFPISLKISIPGIERNNATKSPKPFSFVQNPKQALKAVVQHLLKATGLEPMDCVICETQVYEIDTNETGDYLMLITVNTFNRCMLSDLLNAFRLTANGYSSLVPIGKKYIKVSMMNAYGVQSMTTFNSKPYTNKIKIQHESVCTGTIFISEKKFYCPAVDLTYGEYREIVAGTVTARRVPQDEFSVMRVPGQSGDDAHAYRICVEDYWKPEHNNGGSLKVSVAVCLFIAMILHTTYLLAW